MIIIENISDIYFTLNGITFPKIYQPLKQGSDSIGIYNIYNTRQQLQNSTSYSEFEIDGISYVSQAQTIEALLNVVYLYEGTVSQSIINNYITNKYLEQTIINNTYTGTVTNAPDEEDITEDVNVLKFKDRSAGFDNLGYKIIRSGFNFGSIPAGHADSIWEIRIDFDLSAASIILPSNVTLKFNGGKFMNGTLVGDNTKVEAGLENIFDSDVVISGTWKVKEVYPEWFGAVADGIIDNKGFFESAFEFSSLSNSVIKLRKGTYFLSEGFIINDIDVNIQGTGKELTKIETDLDSSYAGDAFLKFQGSYGSSSVLTNDAIRNIDHVQVVDGSLFDDGDLILINSDELIDTDRNWGEYIHINKIVGNIIYFNTGIIYDKYKTSENAKITKVNSIGCTVKDLSIVNRNTDTLNNTYGFICLRADNPVFENVSIKNFSRTNLAIVESYNVFVKNYYSQHADENISGSGQGYGLMMHGCTYADVQAVILNSRHCITTDGVANTCSQWHTNIHDSYFASKIARTMVDAHPASDYTTVNNCVFQGYSDDPEYNDPPTAYTTADSLILDGHARVVPRVNNPTNTPLDSATTVANWYFYSISLASGVNVSGNCIVRNCTFYNLSAAFAIRGNYKTLQFENNTMYDCMYFTDDDVLLIDFNISNNKIINKYPFDVYAIDIQQATPIDKEGVIKNLYIENQKFYQNRGAYDNIKLQDIEIYHTSTFRETTPFKTTSHSGAGTELIIDGLKYKGTQPLFLFAEDVVRITGMDIELLGQHLSFTDIPTAQSLIYYEGKLNHKSTHPNAAIYTEYSSPVDVLDINLNIYWAVSAPKWNARETPTQIKFRGSTNESIETYTAGTYGNSQVLNMVSESDDLPTGLGSSDRALTYYNNGIHFWTGTAWKEVTFV